MCPIWVVKNVSYSIYLNSVFQLIFLFSVPFILVYLSTPIQFIRIHCIKLVILAYKSFRFNLLLFFYHARYLGIFIPDNKQNSIHHIMCFYMVSYCKHHACSKAMNEAPYILGKYSLELYESDRSICSITMHVMKGKRTHNIRTRRKLKRVHQCANDD